MKSQAIDLPLKIRIKNIISDIATIRLTKNVQPFTHEESSGYNYDEVEIKVQNRENLESYIANNFEQLYAQGEKEEMKPEVIQAHRFLDSTDWIFAKCFELGLDPRVKYPEVIAQRGTARELIRRYK